MGGGTGGGVVSDGGELTWAEVSAELFAAPLGLDAGFTLEFVPASSVGQWVGGVLTYSGDVICIPYSGGNALRVSPDGGVSTLVLGFSGWESGVLIADGGVLGFPYDTPTFVTISGTGGLLLDAGLPQPGAPNQPFFEGGVITLSQHALLAPSSHVYPGDYDVNARTFRLHDGGIPPVISSDTFYAGAILLADGESAIMVPRMAQQMMLVTPDGASLVGPTNMQGHAGGLLMPDASVLLVPNTSGATFVLWDGTSTSVPNPGLSPPGYFSAAWSTNGYAYAIQTDNVVAPAIAIIDRAGSVTQVQLPPDAGLSINSHYGLVTLPSGVIVGCPYSSPRVLFIVPHERRTVSLRAMTSPWLNKW